MTPAEQEEADRRAREAAQAALPALDRIRVPPPPGVAAAGVVPPPPETVEPPEAAPDAPAVAEADAPDPEEPPAKVPSGPRERALELVQARVGKGAKQTRDYTGVDTADAVRGVFHRLANAMRAGAGRRTTEFRSLGDEARARDTAADQRALAQQNAEARQSATERAAAAMQRRLDLAEQAASQRGEASDALNRYRDRMASIQEAQLPGRIEATQALTGQRAATTDVLRGEHDPNSPEAQRALAATNYARDVRSQATGRDLPAVPEGLSASELSDVQQSIRAVPARARGTGTGGMGSGGAASREQLRAAAIAQGMPEATVDALLASGERGRRALITNLGSEGRSIAHVENVANANEERGTELLQGVRSRVPINAPEARRFRDGVQSAHQAYTAINEIDRIGRQHSGLETAISPAIRAELAQHRGQLLGYMAHVRETGVIQPSEMPGIVALIPDPANFVGRTLGAYRAAMAAFQRNIEAAVVAAAVGRDLDADSQRNLLARVRSGIQGNAAPSQRTAAPAQRSAPPAGMVAMISPDGTRGNIPEANVARALERGYRRADAAR